LLIARIDNILAWFERYDEVKVRSGR